MKTRKNWEKVPSVTTGGMPYFWIHLQSKRVVVWSRIHNKWQIKKDKWIYHILFSSDEIAMNVAESIPLPSTKLDIHK